MDVNSKFQEAETLIQEYELMSNPRDFFIVYSILDYINSRSILEAGTGSGAWPIVLTRMGIQSHYTLIENFMYSNEGFSNFDKFWPNNKIELETHLKVNGVERYFVFDKDVEEYSSFEKFDCVRIDLDTDYSTVQSLMNCLDDTGVLLIDDVNKFHRLLYVIQQEDFYPIWIGEKESAWTKDKQLQHSIINSIKEITVDNLQIDFYQVNNWTFLESYSSKWLSNFTKLKRN